MKLENNLRLWREAAGMSREQLAEQLDVSAVSIYRIEQGQQQPRTALLESIAKTFRHSTADFYGQSTNVLPVPSGGRRIPVLDFVSAGDFMVVAESSCKDSEETITTDLDPSADSFALRIRGRSMEPDFIEGDLVLIDPAIYPRAEDFVVAVDEKGEANFKRFHNAGLNAEGLQVFELVPLNPAYPVWRSDRMVITIRGTMIEHRRFRRK